MKVFMNRIPVKGPWGGGNRTLITIIDRLKLRKHEVTFDINDKFDVIYCNDPRPDNRGLRYEHLLYFKNSKNIPIFQRVGDVFYHRGPENTKYLKESLKYSDKISFITDWAADFLDIKIDNKKTYVHELRPPKIFFKEKENKNKSGKIRIMTHHWSDSSLKGVEEYNQIGLLLRKQKYKNVNFFYMGRPNEKLNKALINIIPPHETERVITELDKSDIYVTASKFETGGNHVVEAIARNLPVVYHKMGGGINSICSLSKSKLEFDCIEKFENVLDNLIQIECKNNLKFDNCLEDVCDEYIDIMENLCNYQR